MDKRELIGQICLMDPGAKIELLANYSEEELRDYLEYWETLLESKEMVGAAEG